MAAAEQAVAPAEEMAEAVPAVAESKKRKKAAALKEKKKPAKGKDQKASHPPYFQVWPRRDHLFSVHQDSISKLKLILACCSFG